MSRRLSGVNAVGGMSSTSLLGNGISEHPTSESVISNGNGSTAHPIGPLAESPAGGEGSATTVTNASTWGSNPYGEDGDAAAASVPTGSMHPHSHQRDPSPLNIHRNVDAARRWSGLKHSSGSSNLQSPTTHNMPGPGPGPSSLSGASSIAPSGDGGGSSGVPYFQRGKLAMAHSVVVCGPAGIGKSSLVVANQANWRSCGLWGYAKVVKGESSPFTGLVRCFYFYFYFYFFVTHECLSFSLSCPAFRRSFDS
jgi:hypothetical protein